MIPTRLAFVLAAGLAASCGANAHSEFQNSAWCAQGVVRYYGDFLITRDALDAEQRSRQEATAARCAQVGTPPPIRGAAGDVGGVGTCGVFDPPYEIAYEMARAACGAAPSSGPPTADDPVVAVVTYPPSFNDPDHHETFNFEAGLSGMCGICFEEIRPPRPVGVQIGSPIDRP